MYIIRDSELLTSQQVLASQVDFEHPDRRQRLVARLGRAIMGRFRIVGRTRQGVVAHGVMSTQHPGVMADFSTACGDD